LGIVLARAARAAYRGLGNLERSLGQERGREKSKADLCFGGKWALFFFYSSAREVYLLVMGLIFLLFFGRMGSRPVWTFKNRQILLGEPVQSRNMLIDAANSKICSVPL